MLEKLVFTLINFFYCQENKMFIFFIFFLLNSKFKRIKVPKREVYNYKRADRNALNSSLNSPGCDIELQGEVQVAWRSFKRILFTLMDQHIPKIKIGGVQWRNVASWRPSAPTAPHFGAPPPLKVEGKIEQLKFIKMCVFRAICAILLVL